MFGGFETPQNVGSSSFVLLCNYTALHRLLTLIH